MTQLSDAIGDIMIEQQRQIQDLQARFLDAQASQREEVMALLSAANLVVCYKSDSDSYALTDAIRNLDKAIKRYLERK